MLSAVVEAMAVSSAARLPLLRATGTRIHSDVLVSGGLTGTLSDVLHRDWKGHWTFSTVNEATLKGLSRIEPID